MSVPQTRKYQFMSNNLIDVQQMKNVYNTEKQMIKLGLLNIRSLSTEVVYLLVLATDKVLIVGDFNIHIDNEKDALGSAFIDILNSIGVRQHVTYSLSKSYSRSNTVTWNLC